MLKLLSDWERSYNGKAELEKEFRFELSDCDECGTWIESETDTLFVRCVNDIYYVQCWNSKGIRAALGQILGYPVQRVVDYNPQLTAHDHRTHEPYGPV